MFRALRDTRNLKSKETYGGSQFGILFVIQDSL